MCDSNGKEGGGVLSMKAQKQRGMGGIQEIARFTGEYLNTLQGRYFYIRQEKSEWSIVHVFAF